MFPTIVSYLKGYTLLHYNLAVLLLLLGYTDIVMMFHYSGIIMSLSMYVMASRAFCGGILWRHNSQQEQSRLVSISSQTMDC